MDIDTSQKFLSGAIAATRDGFFKWDMLGDAGFIAYFNEFKIKIHPGSDDGTDPYVTIDDGQKEETVSCCQDLLDVVKEVKSGEITRCDTMRCRIDDRLKQFAFQPGVPIMRDEDKGLCVFYDCSYHGRVTDECKYDGFCEWCGDKKRPDSIVGVILHRNDVREDLGVYMTASGMIGCEDFPSSEYSALPVELRACDTVADYFLGEFGLDEFLPPAEISLMVRTALDAFMHDPLRASVDLRLAFSSWSSKYDTDYGWEYDAGYDFVGFIKDLVAVERP